MEEKHIAESKIHTLEQQVKELQNSIDSQTECKIQLTETNNYYVDGQNIDCTPMGTGTYHGVHFLCIYFTFFHFYTRMGHLPCVSLFSQNLQQLFLVAPRFLPGSPAESNLQCRKCRLACLYISHTD
ncbi:MAG: hypothetical protein LIP12_11900 [Clostridiales bacterium]|nr:hypothetical protein [Clostridiales bacterium]